MKGQNKESQNWVHWNHKKINWNAYIGLEIYFLSDRIPNNIDYKNIIAKEYITNNN